MNTAIPTPGVSTHFRCIEDADYWDLTPGKIYKILEWMDDYFHFIDDKGRRKGWWCRYGAEDASYEANLKEILE